MCWNVQKSHRRAKLWKRNGFQNCRGCTGDKSKPMEIGGDRGWEYTYQWDKKGDESGGCADSDGGGDAYRNDEDTEIDEDGYGDDRDEDGDGERREEVIDCGEGTGLEGEC